MCPDPVIRFPCGMGVIVDHARKGLKVTALTKIARAPLLDLWGSSSQLTDASACLECYTSDVCDGVKAACG
eukprot:1934050-Amphidinium_carterae.1